MRKATYTNYHLLPPAYEKRRQRMHVVDSLKIKGLPSLKQDVGKRNELQSSSDIKRKTMVLATKKVTARETITYINKIKPHALYELMLFSSGQTALSGFKDHSKSFQEFILEQVGTFAEFAHINKLTPVASWSYDPDTHDRESLQHEKRFHMHLVCRRRRGLKFISQHTTAFKQLTTNRQRRICDESTVLISEIARELLEKKTKFKIFEIVRNSKDDLSGTLLKLRIKGGWHSFFKHESAKELSQIEQLLGNIQTTLKKGVTAGTNGIWKRARLKSNNEILHFIKRNQLNASRKTQTLIMHFYQQLQKQPRVDDSKAQTYNRDTLTYLYPLAGPAHSVTITEYNGDVFAYIRPALYSDLGGAGVCVINDTIVKLKKGIGTFSEKEVAKRNKFQKNLVQHLLRN